jgi:hypothetical protein
MSEWISVKDRLPEEGQQVDIWYRGKRHASYELIVDYGGKKGNTFFDPVAGGTSCIRIQGDVHCDEGATHWMPLPEPPKK